MNIKIICRECFWIGSENELVSNLTQNEEISLCPHCFSTEIDFGINVNEPELEDEEIYSEELDDM